MFTGIIEQMGTVQEIIFSGTNKTFWIASPLSDEFIVDQSIAHNGVCLTVEESGDKLHRVTAVEETLQKTNLNSWEKGTVVNWALEGPSPYMWGQAGFNRNTVKTGQEVTAVVYPSRVPNTPNALLAKIILPNGKEILQFQREAGQPAQ